jgi:vibriolysin
MKTLRPLAASVAVLLASSSIGVMANEAFEVKNATATGTPSFVVGQLGSATANNTIATLKGILASQASFRANGNEDFAVKRQWVDDLGKRHTHLSQTINGLKVYGTSMIVHADVLSNDANSLVNTSGEANVYAVSGTLAVSNENAKGVFAVSAKAKVASVKALASEIGKVNGKPELAYVYLPLTDEAKLAWKMEVSWDNGGDDFGRDLVFFDAHSSELLTRHAQVHQAKNWKTHSLDNQDQNAAPGRLLCTNTQSCGDASATRAHNGASSVYDYYKTVFGRNGINNNDLTMVSSVHLGRNVANAYWTGSQMIYGDGDGQQLGDLTLSYEVIGHELTHGVTQYTANLVYANESGALNEAWSDIMGTAAKAYKNNAAADWLLAKETYTPNTPGDAMRYMDDPTKDNYSKDWYPDRIPYTSNPNNQNDQGGVHGNSGIANLAFVLTVQGGSHPRGKSSAQVPALGLSKAEKIYYRALSTYMSQSTNFAGARTATAQAAQDLYGATEKTAVETAWCAVGVGSCPTGPTDPTDPTDPKPGELQNGVAKTAVSAGAGQEVSFTLDVPQGSSNISFAMSGGTGDADMYVKFGSAPTDTSYDCRPYKNGNAETCTGTQSGGKYYVRLKAFSAFSGVSLVGRYDGGSTGGLPPINDSLNNLSVGQGQWAQYYQDLVAGYSSLTISISGGTGDVDLFVRYGAQPTASAYDCRPYLNGNNESCSFNAPAAGRWNIGLNGYAAATGVTLNVTANP